MVHFSWFCLVHVLVLGLSSHHCFTFRVPGYQGFARSSIDQLIGLFDNLECLLALGAAIIDACCYFLALEGRPVPLAQLLLLLYLLLVLYYFPQLPFFVPVAIFIRLAGDRGVVFPQLFQVLFGVGGSLLGPSFLRVIVFFEDAQLLHSYL